jgi:predicted DCC family thiol-disulfide oxidoreductase YuxK
MSASIALLYDGTCGFCVRSLRVLKRLDFLGRLELVDATDRQGVEERFPLARTANLDSAMYAVTKGGLYRGFDAFRRAGWALPIVAWLMPLLYVPGVPQVGRWLYGIVARNRKSLGCESDVCLRP